MPREFIHDQYSPLDYKSAAFGADGKRPGVASWVPPEHHRRLTAYRVLAAYGDNIARNFLPTSLTEEQIRKYREYGHAERIIVGARAAVLGDEQSIYVPDADPVELPDGQTQQPAQQQVAAQALELLQQWALDERLWLEMNEAEHDASLLGDAVWTLYWDPEKARPRVVTYDPGFYFPAPSTGPGNDFTRRPHIAWEEMGPDGTTPQLHLLTWSLEPIRPASTVEPDGTIHYLHTDDGLPVPQDGDSLDSEGQLIRDYPWNEGKPGRLTCLFSEALYDLSKIRGNLFDLSSQRARYLVRDQDLRLDFIPVVHEPNTPARREGFGRSTLTLIAQLLDDLSSTDTDLAESGALVGNATLVTKGGPSGGLDAGPGRHLDLPTDGAAEYLDVSKNLDALIKLKASQAKDLSINTRLTDAVLGRVDAGNAVSGLALALSFSPTAELVRELRAVRDEKYPLLLKFVLRMFQAADLLPAGPTPAAQILFGSFLPADKTQAVTLVSEAVKAHVMSLDTAVLYLQEVGFPIDDAATEVDRIRRMMFEQAVQLVEATGNIADAYQFLGLTPASAAGAGAAGA